MISQLSRPSQPGEHLLHHEHLGIPIASDHLDPDVLGVAMKLDVEGRLTNSDVGDRDSLQKWREHGPKEGDPVVGPGDGEPKAGL